ncbi:MAG TPA: response regulator [Cytophaga sp.]|jgi:DNA-binding NarL/FixJ family response regulator|nr:response regulator [Cytophaga sp.]
MIVLIVDSSTHIVESIAGLLSEAEEDTIIHTALTYSEAVRLFNETKPEVVVVDKSLPENKLIDFLKHIKSSGIKTRIICLSSRIDNNIEAQCKLLGADFFLDKYNEFEMIPMMLKAFKQSDNE